ncbi:MAG: substrate-binding domain-containing protein [Rhodobacterales bacterium]|jgi:tungstate transport system substrate-binding protein|nr:substrate-binding domain-containing protein [Pseudomonadota bacterium]MDA1287757.1 substrate-binding domain-containing protein [Pseudomonadota bacterium]NQW12760.1 substrate-binding domain-containing protein [Rhodobacter sp.]HBN32491.1 sulfate transporter [Paracoccaceae bacterium]
MIRVLLIFLLATLPAAAAERFITLASTTSTQNSGLLDAILPIFTSKTGITVHVIAVGTGQAMRIAQNGDADVLLVHHLPSEVAFVASGHGIDRRDVMYNDFVIVGPSNDPAGVKGQPDVISAMRAIATSKQLFASRGDDSGTHKKEQELWAAANISPTGSWYLETGSGMGATLNLAQVKQAYALSDRGTWITFGNKGDLALLFAGDNALFNPYGVILVNPARHPYVKAADARSFIDWLVSTEGQAAIGAFRIQGFEAFCPNASNLTAKLRDRTACPADND